MGTAMDPNLLGVRDTLNKQFGIDNNRIGYNTNNGMVQVDGQDVFKPQSNVDGTTYATKAQFNSVAGRLNNMNQQNKLMQMATNPQGMNPYGSQVGDLVNKLQTMNSQAPVSMQDVYSSPQYAAAKAQQSLEAQQGINAAQEALGNTGMARSSDLATTAQNVQNRANQYLETQAAPQILQALQGQRQQQMNNVENMLSSLSGLNNQANETALNQQNGAQRLLELLNQQQQNQFQNKVAEAGLTGQFDGQQTLAGQQAQLQHNQVMAELTGKLPDGTPTNAAQQQQLANEWKAADAMGVITPGLSQLYGIPAGTPTMQAKQIAAEINARNASIGIEAKNAATSAGRLSWDQNPSNPQNQYYGAQVKRDNALAQSYENNKNSTVDQAYLAALDTAAKNPLFSTMPPDQQQALVDSYYKIISKKSGSGAGNNGPSDSDIAQYLLK